MAFYPGEWPKDHLQGMSGKSGENRSNILQQNQSDINK